MTDEFTALELAALKDFSSRFPEDREALDRQLSEARFSSRENTGAGFYIHFEVPRSGQPLAGERMRSGCWAEVDGFHNPVGFILWLTDGYADCLEIFTVDDSTVGLNPTALTFRFPVQP